MKHFVEELRWRGMIHDIMPGTEEQLQKESTAGYVGFDPTADSLHLGSLVQIMLLLHFQRCGHKPVILVGGATGMIGDPSGKSEERKLLSVEEIRHNAQCIERQLKKILDFSGEKNSAELVNNNDWFLEMNTITFLREVGKFLTVSYLMGKGFIKDRKNQEMSYTEFNYILMQAYDFLYLHQNKNCKIQMGGSDQWGNITAGAELIRKKIRGQAFAVTCPLLVKSDGSKFGKTESGNVWLDKNKTSPYKFYQFWINSSDDDVKKYMRIFTLFSKQEIEDLEKEHEDAPHNRVLQKSLAKDVTVRVHSEEDFRAAEDASQILFGKGTSESLKKLSEDTLLSIFEGVPQSGIPNSEIEAGINIIDFLSEKTDVTGSKGEARRIMRGGGISINKEKVTDESMKINKEHLLNGKYILVQKGKKDYHLVKKV